MEVKRDAHMDMSLLGAATETALAIGLFSATFHLLASTLSSASVAKRLNITKVTGYDMACKLVSAMFAVAASSSGAFLMFFADIVPSKVHPLLSHIFLVVIAYFIYDLYAMFRVFEVQKRPEETTLSLLSRFSKAKPLLIVHHVAVGCVFTPMMTTRMDHEPGELMVACALIFEASTPFVSLRAVLSYLDLKKSLLYVVNGLVMVVMFFSCRILIYPVFYLSYARQKGISFVQALGSTPNCCVVFMTLCFLPQVYWFYVMVKGAAKVLEQRKETSNGVAKKEE